MSMNKNKQIFFAIAKLVRDLTKKDINFFFLSIIFCITYVVYDSSIAFAPKILLDTIAMGGEFEMIKYAVGFVLIGGGAGIIYSIVFECSRARIGFVRVDYLADAFNKIITCDYKYMEDASFLNKYDSAFDACSNSESGIEKVYKILFEMPAIIGKTIVFAVVVCSFSPIIVGVAILHVMVSIWAGKKASSFKYVYKEQLSKVNRKKRYFNNITQDFQYGKDIRLYSFQELLYGKYYDEIREYRNILIIIKNKEYYVGLIILLTMILCDIAIYGSLVIKATAGISLANVTMYFIAVNMFMQVLNRLANNFSDMYGEGLYIVDFFNFINAELSTGQSGYSMNDNINNTLGIDIKDYKFKYPNTEKYVIEGVNFSIAPGEKIAIVGENGVGKTTFIKSLVGLFREYEGEIKVGSTDISHLSNEELFSLFAVVFQDINILAYSISENITGSSGVVDTNKIWDTLMKVGLAEKISTFPNGINSQVHKFIDENGVEFSGGEYQRLALARAIYKNAKILILDEPTAALDPLAEKELYEKFNEIVNGKTTIFISHRLASTKFCDRIFLLGDKGIIEQGTHKELMDLKGNYYNMFMLQAKYYQES